MKIPWHVLRSLAMLVAGAAALHSSSDISQSEAASHSENSGRHDANKIYSIGSSRQGELDVQKTRREGNETVVVKERRTKKTAESATSADKSNSLPDPFPDSSPSPHPVSLFVSSAGFPQADPVITAAKWGKAAAVMKKKRSYVSWKVRDDLIKERELARVQFEIEQAALLTEQRLSQKRTETQHALNLHEQAKIAAMAKAFEAIAARDAASTQEASTTAPAA